MDANFRLKNNLVSNYSQDPGLGTGWAYLLPRVAYEMYVLSRASDEDVSFSLCCFLQGSHALVVDLVVREFSGPSSSVHHEYRRPLLYRHGDGIVCLLGDDFAAWCRQSPKE